MSSGEHSLTFEVFDVFGNKASRTINFVVGQPNGLEIALEQAPVVDEAVFNLAGDGVNGTPNVHLRVTDVTGRVLWNTHTSTFPLRWDLKDNSGNKLVPGFYKYYATYETDSDYGSTSSSNLVVIEQLKRE